MKLKNLYNFKIDVGVRAKAVEQLNHRRLEFFVHDLEKIDLEVDIHGDVQGWWDVDIHGRLLFLVGPEGFAEMPLTNFRVFLVEEIERAAIAVYIASLKEADKAVRAINRSNIEDEKEEENKREAEKAVNRYLETMRRVIPNGIGITQLLRMLENVRVQISCTEWYERCSIEAEVEISDYYEIIVVLAKNSELFKREYVERDYSDESEPDKTINERRQEGRWKETSCRAR